MEVSPMKNCPKHGPYPNRFPECPICNPDAESEPAPKVDPFAIVTQMSDTEVRYIFQTVFWESGTKEMREFCLAEYDKRFGLANWPAHISKEA
jgi:hypothetical protein